MRLRQPKLVDQKRAAVLLGVWESELRRISAKSRVGCKEKRGPDEQMVFSYENLRRICLLSVAQAH